MRKTQSPNPISVVEFDYAVTGLELRDALFNKNVRVHVPISQAWLAGRDASQAVAALFEMPEIILSARYQSASGGTGWIGCETYPSTDIGGRPPSAKWLDIWFNEQGGFTTNLYDGENDNIGLQMGAYLTEHTYLFDAQRIPQNDFPFGGGVRLSQNADNLAQVLIGLQANRTEFGNYVAHVRRVLPLIKWVSVTSSPHRGQNAEIKIWNVEENTGRDDLAVPLSQCGTGIGQVLAILFVVTRSANNVIIIDEPNSFLHPRASKELIGILSENRQNQFIISTHSPETIAAAQPERLFILGFENERTMVRQVDRKDLNSARQVLDELGSQLSDVFGADFVLWVEGPTEVDCFPVLLKALGRELPVGLAIAPLRNTGELESKRHAEIVADIYRNLSSAHTVLPTTIGLSLDGDKKGLDSERTLKIAFGDVIHFLERRCYESYLLHCEAIASLLNSLPSFQSQAVSVDAVRTWIEAEGRKKLYKADNFLPFTKEWMKAVDAPVLLEQLFQDLSGAKETYRKTLHSIELTRWLLANDRAFIQELIDYVASLVPDRLH